MTRDLGSHDRRLHKLSDTMRAFAEATMNNERLLSTVAERMATLVGGGCVLALLSEDDKSLVPGAVCFDDPVAMVAARGILTNGSVPLHASNLGALIAQHRNGLLIPQLDPLAVYGRRQGRAHRAAPRPSCWWRTKRR